MFLFSRTSPFLVLGLGNPGTRYQGTRHNVGFLAVDALVGAEPWGEKKKLKALIATVRQDTTKIIFAKPLTFMNDSGEAAVKLAHFFNIAPQHILVIHDDLDITLGQTKLQFDRGAAGHHGVESIVERLGTRAFWRLRVGIAPQDGSKPQQGKNFVLQSFTAQEEQHLQTQLANLHTVLDEWLTHR